MNHDGVTNGNDGHRLIYHMLFTTRQKEPKMKSASTRFFLLA